jgi:hypothetical protein
MVGLQVWQRQWLEANCIFVNLEHRLYQPTEMLAPIFMPRPRPAIPIQDFEQEAHVEFPHANVEPMDLFGDLEYEDRMEGPSRIVDDGVGRFPPHPPVMIDENTVYLEDLLAPGQKY